MTKYYKLKTSTDTQAHILSITCDARTNEQVAKDNAFADYVKTFGSLD